jgi:hypothetical protein
MPPIRSKKKQDSIYQEGRISLAIQAIQNKSILSIAAAARAYDVPRSTLRDRVNGVLSQTTLRANGHKLTQLDEDILTKWILCMDDRGAAPRPPMVRTMANILLAATGDDVVGKCWVTNFIKRTPAIQTRFSRRYNYARAQQEDPSILRAWFKRLEETICQYGILQDDIYNFDETGFAMGLVSTAKVVTRAEYYGRRSVIQPGNREWVTTVETINACGWALPPLIIFKGKRYIESWFCSDLPNDWRFEVSPNGWTNDAIGLRWLEKLFIPATTSRTRGQYRLLILDGHGSHLTPEFDRICATNNVIPICMPPHSSHLLQPLDVGCFAVLKRSYSALVDQQARSGVNHIDKLDFLTAYPHARADAFKINTIQSAFRATGIVPIDAEPVLSKLNIQLRTPTPVPRPSSRSSVYYPETPANVKQLIKHKVSTKRLIKYRSDSPPTPTKDQVTQVYKACEAALKNNTILREENSRLRSELYKKTKKKALPKRQIARDEGISVGEAHEQGIGVLHTLEGGVVVSATLTQRGAETSDATKRRQYACSVCRRPGHRANVCPDRV